ncbi:response regulator transcription factor [Cryobacterium sp. Y82]|uniref:response regulator transcription factor n=1 Tax=Cryobacterium sp. Y82 TaxID=2045017 RepID=UPI000CE54632|nr:response regulator transcription factor [Cryobacterium sp. Y82]
MTGNLTGDTPSDSPHQQRDGLIRVLLADDDQLVRAGIAGILSTAPDIVITAEASDGTEALELARRHSLDVVVLDIQMPRLDGIRTLEQLRREQPHVPVAMLTTFSDEAYIAEAITLGALGFFLKSDDPRHLIGGVRALAGGGAAFSPRVGRWLVRQETGARFGRSTRAQSTVRELTHRQRELLAGIGRGQSNAQIAKSLHLSEGTVKQYLSVLFTALGAENRVQAAIIAYEAELLNERP